MRTTVAIAVYPNAWVNLKSASPSLACEIPRFAAFRPALILTRSSRKSLLANIGGLTGEPQAPGAGPHGPRNSPRAYSPAVHTLEPELRTLHAEGTIDDATASRALARDRREVFSLHHELRATLYAGVLLVMAGVGIILARNLERIGPLTVVLAIALAAAACAVPAVRVEGCGSPAHRRWRLLAAPRSTAAQRRPRLRRASVHAARPVVVVAPVAARRRPRRHRLRLCLAARAGGVPHRAGRLVRRRRHARRRAAFLRLDAAARRPVPSSAPP